MIPTAWITFLLLVYLLNSTITSLSYSSSKFWCFYRSSSSLYFCLCWLLFSSSSSSVLDSSSFSLSPSLYFPFPLWAFSSSLEAPLCSFLCRFFLSSCLKSADSSSLSLYRSFLPFLYSSLVRPKAFPSFLAALPFEAEEIWLRLDFFISSRFSGTTSWFGVAACSFGALVFEMDVFWSLPNRALKFSDEDLGRIFPSF